MSSDTERLRKECELYRFCLELSGAEEPAPLLQQAIARLRSLAGAAFGYIEVRDTHREAQHCWHADIGLEDDDRRLIRERISQGIVAEAIETGDTLHIPDALLDQRFSGRASVRRQQINAVLCVPMRTEGMTGVLYLQNRDGVGGEFLPDDVAAVETVARFVTTVAARLLELLRRREEEDSTTEVRTRLKADGVIGRSPALAALMTRVEVVASMQGNVLFTGPSGAGKSMFARVLHDNSPRADAPFIELNCAALPEQLVESELFGAQKGAHSGVADRASTGKVQAAEGGTLFLDEVGELRPEIQAKLLQFLQSKQYYPLGAARPRTANVRVISATNRNLEEAMQNGSFREDLYYRLRGVEIRLPTLDERREDLPPLAKVLCRSACERNGLSNMTISNGALAAIEFADWPGNVRQLSNACEEAVVAARIDGSTRIELRHVFPGRPHKSDRSGTTFQEFRDSRDRAFLEEALLASDWNVAQTARDLEMSRSHLNALIRRFELRRA